MATPAASNGIVATGLGLHYDMSQYVNQEDIQREPAKMMEKFRGEAT